MPGVVMMRAFGRRRCVFQGGTDPSTPLRSAQDDIRYSIVVALNWNLRQRYRIGHSQEQLDDLRPPVPNCHRRLRACAACDMGKGNDTERVWEVAIR